MLLGSSSSTSTAGSASRGAGPPAAEAGARRQRQRKRRTGPRLALDLQRAAEQCSKPSAERQAQSRTFDARLQRAFDLGEFFEDALLVLGRDANTRVAHPNAEAASVVARFGADAHFAAFGELECIRHQIAHDLRYLGLVGDHRGQRSAVVELQRHVLVREQRPQHAAQHTEQLVD
jgi:hypothetical protein